MTQFNLKVLKHTVFSVFGRLQSDRCRDPELTPENWCEKQPCMVIRLSSGEIVLTQPSSTFWVYFLGLLTIFVGLYFLWNMDSELSRLWWGISLLLWGIGALLAGTSYQAFAYHIKCAGRLSCAWTSWWEVIYLMFQQVSMNAMLIAVSYSCTTGTLRSGLVIYALVSSVLYVVATLIGGLVPVKSLITFNLMVWVSTPVVVFVIMLNGWRYFQLGNPMDLMLLLTWVLLLITSATYTFYDHFRITERLWKKGTGIWFSQNDVLHVGLILWVIFIWVAVADQVKDYAG
jgi:hypothetical protein